MTDDKAIRAALLTAKGSQKKLLHQDGPLSIYKQYNDTYIAEHEGQKVGEMNLSSRAPYATSVEVHPQFRRMGIASKLYDAAERDIGRKMMPSPLGLSSDATQMWKKRLNDYDDPTQKADIVREAINVGRSAGVGKSSAERMMPFGYDPETEKVKGYSMGGILEKNRAKQAQERAPGQIAPSKYMPNVPRAVHAAGGYVPAPMMMGAPRLAVAKAPRQAPQQEADVLASLSSLSDTAKSISGEDAPPATAPEPHAARAEPHGYGEGISAAAAKAMAALQGAWTGQDFGIVSGYRDPKQNAAANGVKDSQHLHGNAFDFNTTGWPEEEKLLLADAAWDAGFRGVGFYDNNMHFDVGDPRGWGPSFSRDSIPDWAQGWTQNRYGYAGGGGIGGKDAFQQGNHPLVPDVLYHGNAPKVVENSTYHGDGKWTAEVDQEATDKNIASQDFRAFKPSAFGNYGPGIYLSDSPKIASDFAQGIRADQTEAKPHGQVLKLNVSMKQPFHDDVLKHPEWAAYIKEALTKHRLSDSDELAARDAFLASLDSGKATVRDMFVHEGKYGTMVNQFGQNDVLDTIRNSGFDGIIAHRPDGSKEYVAFHPHQIKSAIGNQGTFDPTDPDITKADGGEIADLGQAREQKKVQAFHTGLMGDMKTSVNSMMEAHQKALDAGVFDGYEVGDVLQGSAHPMRITGRFMRKWKPSSMTLQSFDRMGAKPTIIEHEDTQYIPMLRYQTGMEGQDGFQEGDAYLDGVKAAGYQKMGGLRAVRALGGRTVTDHGLYSRAAEIIRGLPQEKGTVDQYIAAAKKLGAKPSELEHAGRPEGDKISREDMAKHFDRNLPKMEVHQYGENPSYLSKEQEKRLYEMWNKPKSEAEQAEYDLLMRRTKGPQVKYESNEYNEDNEPRPTEYQDYNLPGGSNYRERLLTLPETGGGNDYRSSHWSDNDNVLAHIRMSDRTMGGDRESMRPAVQKLADHMGVGVRDLAAGSAELGVNKGVISPEEAASISRLMRWSASPYYNKPGLDKRVLHIEEMQSDWGQQGRDKGFYDPKNPYEIFNTKTGETVSKHPSQDAMWDAYRSIPEDQAAGLDYGHARHTSEKKPAAPYVQNTQHWTDLALKNIMHEAAMGNYDHVVFTPGQAQADRYGLEKKLSRIELRRPSPDKIEGSRLLMYGLNGNQMGDAVQVKDEDHLRSLIGSDVSGRLMQAPGVPGYNVSYGNHVAHTVQGDDLKMGGEGMKGYYDNILPKSVMRLAQQHDPDIKPGSMELPEGHTGFSIPMTDKLRQGILAGQPALKRGGAVEKADGGPTNGQQDTTRTPQARPQAGELPVSGGVRGSGGVLPAQGETPLEGLPQNIRIPLTGGSLQAGPDPRIREIARQYMATSGLPYNPPAKYAKVDPGRAKRIAAAYDAMTDNPDDPLTKASYAALAKETMAQYQAAKAAGFKAEFWHPSKQEDPYLASPRLAVEDVRNNHHMWVYPTYAGYGSGEITDEDVQKNPMLQGTGEHWNGIPVTVNDVFRAIHDYYGHAKEGVGFRADGEENAWRAHASMFSPLARMAMTSETRGQNSWLNYGPHGEANRGARTEDTVFAPQKVGIMPDWVHHEGAEDFIRPEDVAEMKRVRAKHSFDFEKALGITRGFTKDGKTATMKLKLKE
jgi:GNAT superfamily N-acetyltransferase